MHTRHRQQARTRSSKTKNEDAHARIRQSDDSASDIEQSASIVASHTTTNIPPKSAQPPHRLLEKQEKVQQTYSKSSSWFWKFLIILVLTVFVVIGRLVLDLHTNKDENNNYNKDVSSSFLQLDSNGNGDNTHHTTKLVTERINKSRPSNITISKKEEMEEHTLSSLTSGADLGSRDILIYNHNPKAGGGSIIKVLRDLRTYQIVPKGGLVVSPKEDFQATISRKPDHTTANSFFLLKEQVKSTKTTRKQGFIIGSIREPCSHYVSLWAYGSTKKGLFRYQILKGKHRINNTATEEENSKLYYGQHAPSFNTSDDIERFHRWMNHPSVHGLIADRLQRIYSKNRRDLDGVDCYVYVEQFQSSLIHCLQKFEAQGGYVNWTKPIIASMLQSNSNSSTTGTATAAAERTKHRNLRKNGLQFKRKYTYVKNDPLGNPQVAHHASCNTYFNSSLVEMIQNGPEKFIYDTFGYKGCCSKEITI